MPGPLSVLNRFFEMFLEKNTYLILFSSLYRLMISISLSAVLGTIFGLMSGVEKKVELFFRPLVSTLRTLPVISIIIVILIVFGNEITLYIISLLLLFPIIYQAVLDGVKNIDSLLIDVVKLDSSSRNYDALRMVYLPLSIPFLRSALIDAVGLGFKVLVVAEYIAQTNQSIGKTIYMHKINLEFTDVFAWTLMLLVFVLIIEGLVEKLLKIKCD